MNKYEKFAQSRERFLEQTKEQRKGYLLWECYKDNFKIESWTMEHPETKKLEPTIIQIWKDGAGYNIYRQD